ncbi:MAG: tetratricopeptide repeat protein [Gammaproteobacteria bacterium]|nr:tetratricopeptide repeat protein [Gammaproteobacteria bacterium]
MARSRRLAPLLGICWALGGASPFAVHAASPLAEVIQASRESARLDVDAIRGVYDDAIVGDGGIERTLKRLAVFAAARNRSSEQRANIHLVIAHIHWRHGDRAASLAAIETAMDHRETTDGLLLMARLLDVAGDVEAAVTFYERALAATKRKEEAEFIRIRLTMAEARARNVEALIDLARERDQSFKNRAAIALAVLGHPDLGSEIYRAVKDDPGRAYREHLRLAQWALASGAHPVAQREAWRAFEAAGLQIDARYALMLLVESHRDEGTLAELVDGLDERGARGTAMLDELRVDLLIETQRYGDAVAFYESVAGHGSGVDVEARQRLIKLYESAGRPEDMVREYRRLMSAEPDVVDWYAGLASHYVGLARHDDALDVWRLFEGANANRAQAVVAAGEQMIGMGFLEEAVAMVERQMAATGEHVEGLLFLFDARFERGRDDDAQAILERMRALLPPEDDAVRDLADAYEQMNRPEQALEIMDALESTQDGLGYNERMRLAWLYSLADRKQDALEAWRALWVSVDSPARRSLAEDQLLLLAAESNTLADIVVELEEKLYAGRADRNEMDLLVRVYTEVGDTLSATEVVEEYARSARVDPVERLRQLANVYRLQNDYPGYDRVLRQLVHQDPDNESEHVQNLVLNLLAHDLAEDSDERYGEIQRWLARLHALDAARVSGEFEAGVLSLGGFDAEAIESYRRALVRNPDNSDNLLLMADRMKSAGRADEAVTMLQYAAEHAADDNAFVVAVDGIINMIGARSFGEALTPEMRGIFQWSQRVILERITAHDGKFYLYQLLADIAQETEDTEGVFLALENSLPLAGIRRPAILRELVTLATPSTGFAGFDTGRGDPERRLIHGRRLIGLRQALPPDVYINLGKALLEKDDVAGAEKALDRIEDITGMIDIDKTKADLLYDAGHPERALENYARALSVNRDNLSLLARNALLQEVRGQLDVANEMYLRALGNLLRGEALTRPGRRATNPGSTRVGFPGRSNLGTSRDYQTYFEFLIQGLLGTWPQSAETAGQRLGAVEAMFDETLQEVIDMEDLADKDVEEFPRLGRTAQFVGRVAGVVGDRELAERIDSAVANIFPKDDEEPLPSTAAAGSLLQRQLEKAKRNGNFRNAVQLARFVGDEEILVEVLRGRIAEGSYSDALVNAWFLLDESAFRRLVTPVASTLKDDAGAFLAFLGDSPHLVPAMEETLGREFASVADLIELIGQGDDSESPAPFSGYRVLPGVWRYVKTKGTLDEQIAFLASLARRDGDNRIRPPDVALAVSDVLAVELSIEQRIAATQAATAYLATQQLSSSYMLGVLLQFLLLDIHPANTEVVYAMAEHLEGRSSSEVDLVAVMKDIHEGNPQRRFEGLLELSKAELWRSGMASNRAIGDWFGDERERILAAVERGEAVPPETASLAYELTFTSFGPVPRQQLKRKAVLAPKFAALDPEGDRYRLDGINALLSLGDWSAAEQALHDFYRENPEDEFLRAALYFRFLAQGRFGAALALVTDGGPDLRDQAVVDDLLDKMSRSGGVSSGLFRRFYPGPIASPYNPYTPVVQRNIDRLREAGLAHTDPAKSSNDSRTSAETTALPDTIENTGESLRAVWRGMTAPGGDGDRRYYPPSPGSVLSLPLAERERDAWSYGPSAPTGAISALFGSSRVEDDRRMLFDVLVEMPEVGRELERYVPALPESERRNQTRCYELLADALDARASTAARLDDLSFRLHDGAISQHDFTLWMTLRHREEEGLSAAELATFARRVGEIDDPTGSELLLIARLFAKSGAFADSAEHYALVAANVLRRGALGGATSRVVMRGAAVQLISFSSGSVFSSVGGTSLATGLAEILAETAERLPREVADGFARRVLAVARPSEDDEALAAIFDAFVLKTLANVVPPAEVFVESAGISPTAAATEATLETWQVPKVLELARLHAMADNPLAALGLIRRFATPDGVRTEPETDWLDEDRSRRAGAASALARTFGLQLLRGYGPASPASWLVHGRERVFPADPDNAWPGAADWMLTAARAMQDWLDDEDVDPATVREMLFVLAWQLHEADHGDAARDILAVLATQIAAETDAGPVELRNLALMSLRLSSPLPADLAVAVVSTGTLSARQEVSLVRELAASDAVGALRTGRAADRGDKLELMRELRPLALAANDVTYARDLESRLEAAQAAFRELGSPDLPGEGRTAVE